MHAAVKSSLVSLLMATATAQAADGLTVPQSAWQPWQTRVSLGGYDTSPRPMVASLLSDYYFKGLRFGSTAASGGFRATSGLMLGAGSSLLGATGVPQRLNGELSLGRVSLTSSGRPGSDGWDAGTTMPYVGIGYTGLAAAGRWGFTADFGVVAQSPSGTVQLGRALFGSQPVDDALRSLRLAPVVQFGVRYSF
jgi:hypothetical protein